MENGFPANHAADFLECVGVVQEPLDMSKPEAPEKQTEGDPDDLSKMTPEVAG